MDPYYPLWTDSQSVKIRAPIRFNRASRVSAKGTKFKEKGRTLD